MARKDETTVYRFIVGGSDGKRSRIWRIWTGEGTKPTDDVYIAPRDSGDKLKVSLHRDGSGQVGIGKAVRDQFFSTDRKALDRWWDLGFESGVRFAFCLDFPESELRYDAPKDTEATSIVAPLLGQTLQLQIVIVDEDDKAGFIIGRLPKHNLELIARLSRRSPGSVLIVKATEPTAAQLIKMAKQLQEAPVTEWAPSVDIGTSKLFGIYAGIQPETSQRYFIEIALNPRDRSQPPVPLVLSQFRGEVRRWDELPIPATFDVCGVVRVEPDRQEVLYYNGHARCDHSSLAKQAHDILDAHRTYGPDSGWTATPDGGWFTFLMTRTIYERLQEADPAAASRLKTGWTL